MSHVYHLPSAVGQARNTAGARSDPVHGRLAPRAYAWPIRFPRMVAAHQISRVYMGSMNDWPEFAVLSDAGEESEWSRYANEPEFAVFYTVGRPIEIDYVVQRTRGTPADFQKIPIEIRVDDQYA